MKGSSESDGAHIVEETYDPDKPSHHFRVQEIGPQSEEVYIYTFCGKVLDIYEQRFKNETIVMQYAWNGGDNQIFTMRHQ